MIKNKNIQMGLLVFFITLIGLLTLAKFYPEDQSVTTDVNAQEKLEIASK
ncbi:MAG: hypothetical protein IIC74_00240 [Bacteroidetes bacterium]|nr:hypothetical protein [Bacteroidota bacterium]